MDAVAEALDYEPLMLNTDGLLAGKTLVLLRLVVNPVVAYAALGLALRTHNEVRRVIVVVHVFEELLYQVGRHEGHVHSRTHYALQAIRGVVPVQRIELRNYSAAVFALHLLREQRAVFQLYH